jgi:DEAD/DEAH box helicase domain-containing protein
MSPRLFERTEELVQGALELVGGCDCEVGCPACVGPRGESRLDGRALATRLLCLLAGPAGRTVPSARAAA